MSYQYLSEVKVNEEGEQDNKKPLLRPSTARNDRLINESFEIGRSWIGSQSPFEAGSGGNCRESMVVHSRNTGPHTHKL